jgi:aminoglycoside phosphotransferase
MSAATRAHGHATFRGLRPHENAAPAHPEMPRSGLRAAPEHAAMTLLGPVCRRDCAYLAGSHLAEDGGREEAQLAAQLRLQPRGTPGHPSGHSRAVSVSRLNSVDDWELVTVGRSAATVRRSPDGLSYAKTASSLAAAVALEAERDRLVWLAGTPVGAPRVVDWDGRAGAWTLVTSALPGVPASALPSADARVAMRQLVAYLAFLHAIPSRECPFDHRLAVTVAVAAANVVAGAVDETDFDEARGGRSAGDLLDRLMADTVRAEALEAGDLAVCHGDFCLPNVLLDPDSLTVTGIVDVGRLGVADRHLDIALLTRSAASPANLGYGTDLATWVIAESGADPWRIEYYSLLDEFF